MSQGPRGVIAEPMFTNSSVSAFEAQSSASEAKLQHLFPPLGCRPKAAKCCKEAEESGCGIIQRRTDQEGQFLFSIESRFRAFLFISGLIPHIAPQELYLQCLQNGFEDDLESFIDLHPALANDPSATSPETPKDKSVRRSLRTRQAKTRLVYDSRYHPADDVLRPATSSRLKQEHPTLRMQKGSPLRKAERDSKRSNHCLDHEDDPDFSKILSQADQALTSINPHAQAPCERLPVSRNFMINERRV